MAAGELRLLRRDKAAALRPWHIKIFQNDNLKRNFPRLDYITKAAIEYKANAVMHFESSHELFAGSADVPSATRRQARDIR